jgi:hypothetical protein
MDGPSSLLRLFRLLCLVPVQILSKRFPPVEKEYLRQYLCRARPIIELDDRVNTGSTLVTSQLPVETWHAYLGEPTLADAMLDRLVHHSHHIELKIPGESMRKSRTPVEV